MTEAEAARRLVLDMVLDVARPVVHLVVGAWAQLGMWPRHPEAAEAPDFGAGAAAAESRRDACRCRVQDVLQEQSVLERLDVPLLPHGLHHQKGWWELRASESVVATLGPVGASHQCPRDSEPVRSKRPQA